MDFLDIIVDDDDAEDIFCDMVDEDIFKEIGAAGDDLFGRCTMEVDLEVVGDDGIEILTKSSSSRTLVLQVAISSTVSFSSNVRV